MTEGSAFALCRAVAQVFRPEAFRALSPASQLLPRQPRNQSPIGRQKIKSRQIPYRRPDHSFRAPISRRGEKLGHAKETDLDGRAVFLVLVECPANQRTDAAGRTEFLAQFPRQSGAGRLARAHFSSGKFPLQLEEISPAALADQQPSLAFDQGCDHSNQALLSIAHFRKKIIQP